MIHDFEEAWRSCTNFLRAVTYYAERLETELGRSPPVSAVATLVRQVRTFFCNHQNLRFLHWLIFFAATSHQSFLWGRCQAEVFTAVLCNSAIDVQQISARFLWDLPTSSKRKRSALHKICNIMSLHSFVIHKLTNIILCLFSVPRKVCSER